VAGALKLDVGWVYHGLDWVGLGCKITTFCGLGWVKLSPVVRNDGENSQIFIAILLITFGQRSIVHPV